MRNVPWLTYILGNAYSSVRHTSKNQPGSWQLLQVEKGCQFPWQQTTMPPGDQLIAHIAEVNQSPSAALIQTRHLSPQAEPTERVFDYQIRVQIHSEISFRFPWHIK